MLVVYTSLLAVVGRSTGLTKTVNDVLVLVDQDVEFFQVGRKASRGSIGALHRVPVGSVVIPVDDGSHVRG